MRKTGKALLSVVLSMLIALAIPFSFLGRNVNAADNDRYIIDGYGKRGVITDSFGNVDPGYGFCLDCTIPSPSNDEYTRVLLADTNYDDDTKTLLRSIMYNYDALYVHVQEMAETNELAANYLSSYYPQGVNHFYQYLIWAIVFSYNANGAYNGDYVNSAYYQNRVDSFGGASSDPYNDPDSFYNAFLVPVFDYLRDNAPDPSKYDSYVYIPSSRLIQPILGSSMDLSTLTNPAPFSVTLGKVVVDEDGNYIDYNGNDDNGFTFDVRLYNNTIADLVPGVNLTIEREDGSVTTVTTDAYGAFTVTLMCDETVTISGFEGDNLVLFIQESTANFDDEASFVEVISSTTCNVWNGYSAVTLSPDASFTAVNSYEAAAPMVGAVANINPVVPVNPVQPVQPVEPAQTQPTTSQPAETQPATAATTVPAATEPAASTTVPAATEPASTTAASASSDAPAATQPAAASDAQPAATEPSADSAVLGATQPTAAPAVDPTAIDSADDSSVLGAEREVGDDFIADTGESVSALAVTGIVMIVLSIAAYAVSVTMKRKAYRRR